MSGSLQDLNKVSVIVPSKDEAEGIGPTLDELLSMGLRRENIIVVDRSMDETPKVAMSRGVRVLRQRGKGKADAVREGLKAVRTPYVLVIDADHSYPARLLPELLRVAQREGHEEVIGVRPSSSQPVIYRLGNALLTRFFNALFGVRLRDVLSGMYLVRVDALRDALFEMSGFSVESELAAHIVSIGGSIGEVEVEYRPRLGKKKLRPWHGLKIAIDMLRLSWRYNPTVVMFFAGALLLIPGLVIGGVTAYQFYFKHVDHFVHAIMALIVTATGFNSLLLGVQSLYLKRFELRMRALLRELEKRWSEER
ncbi:MAG: glycosyltransferase family 2 protein [Acidilobus sp.]